MRINSNVRFMKTAIKLVFISLLFCHIFNSNAFAIMEVKLIDNENNVFIVPYSKDGQHIQLLDFYIKNEQGSIIYAASDISALLYAGAVSFYELKNTDYDGTLDKIIDAFIDTSAHISNYQEDETVNRNVGAIAGIAAAAYGGCCVGAVPGAIVGGTAGAVAGGIGAIPGAAGGAIAGCGTGAITGAVTGTIEASLEIWYGYQRAETADEKFDFMMKQASQPYHQALSNLFSATKFANSYNFSDGIGISELFQYNMNLNIGLLFGSVAIEGYNTIRDGIGLPTIIDDLAINITAGLTSIPGASLISDTLYGDYKLLETIELSIFVQQKIDNLDSKIVSGDSKMHTPFNTEKMKSYLQYFDEFIIPGFSFATNNHISTSSSDLGKVQFMLFGISENLEIGDSVSINYGDGNSETINSNSFPINGVFQWTHYYSVQSSSYETTVTYTVDFNGDEYSKISKITIPADYNPPDVEYAPHTYRVSPDYSTYRVVGDSITFIVRGVDPDSNLDYVVWESEGPILLNDDRDNYNDGHEGTETVTGIITGDNSGEKFYVYATSYDTLGNSSDREKWVLEARPNYAPVITKINPTEQDIQLEFGEHEFLVTVFDDDDNAGTLEWYLDGVLVEQDSTGGGNPASNEKYDLNLSQRDTHVLEAKIIDDDDNPTSVLWNIEAGTSINGNLPPEITRFSLDDYSVPFQIFRAGRAYEFEADAIDLDGNLYSFGFKVNGEFVYEDIDNSPDGNENISHHISFPTTGSYQLTAFAKDSANEIAEETMIIEVLEADTSQGGAPEFGNIYPNGNTIYVNPGNSLSIGGWVNDPDWDEMWINVYIDNQLIVGEQEHVYNHSNFDFSINSDYIPDSGTHTLKIVPVDVTGKQGQAKQWSLIAGVGNHAPTITRVFPDTNETIYVLQGDLFEPYIFVQDIDGDLGNPNDDVVWDWSGVGDPDPDDHSWADGHWDSSDANVRPVSSGTFTATVYDSGGRSATTSFNIEMVSVLQNHPPKILRGNIPVDGSSFVRINYDGSYNLEYSLDVFDPDGDLEYVKLFENGIVVEERIDINDYMLDSTLESRGTDSDFVNRSGPKTRGETYSYLLEIADSKGNVVKRQWTVTQGPVNESNHAPIVDETLSKTMNQYDTLEFTIDVLDEEGDIPEPTIQNIGSGHQVEYLGDYKFKFIPDDDFYGETSFEILWNDGFGGISTSVITVNVNYVILPPSILQSSLTFYVDAGENLNLIDKLSNNVVSQEYDYSQLLIKTPSSNKLIIQGSDQVSDGSFMASIEDGNTTGTVNLYFEDPSGRTSSIVNIKLLVKDYLVSVNIPNEGGTCSLEISPTPVLSGESLFMDFIPATDYTLESVSGCAGSLIGNTYTTGALTANCTVSAFFVNSIDTDGDSISDQWELDYFGDLDTANGTSDYDKDGYLDIIEYGNGTDPIIQSVSGGPGYDQKTDNRVPKSIPAINLLLLSDKKPKIDITGYWDLYIPSMEAQKIDAFYLNQNNTVITGVEILGGEITGSIVKDSVNFQFSADGDTGLFSGSITNNIIQGSITGDIGEFNNVRLEESSFYFKNFSPGQALTTTPSFSWVAYDGADKYFIRVMKDNAEGTCGDDQSCAGIWEKGEISGTTIVFNSDGNATEGLIPGNRYRVNLFARTSDQIGIPDTDDDYLEKTMDWVFYVQ